MDATGYKVFFFHAGIYIEITPESGHFFPFPTGRSFVYCQILPPEQKDLKNFRRQILF